MAEQPPAKTKDEAVSLMKGADASVEETTPNSNLKPTKPSTPQTSTAGPSTVETLPSSTKRRRPPQVVTKPTTIPPTAETAPPVPARTKPSQKPPPIQEKSKTPTTMIILFLDHAYDWEEDYYYLHDYLGVMIEIVEDAPQKFIDLTLRIDLIRGYKQLLILKKLEVMFMDGNQKPMETKPSIDDASNWKLKSKMKLILTTMIL
uniref:Uncharacterized protein n=1 Tax=Panagrolaimus sp. JU765 TaxID=591449 RepID=A0AC34RSL8_9BILA